MNEQNLIPNSERTPEEIKAMTTAGGIASGEARRRKKHGKELIRMLLEMQAKDGRLIKQAVDAGVAADDVTNEVILHLRQMEKAALKADTKAYTAVMKAAGYDLEGVIPEGVTIVVKNEEEARKLRDLDKLDV